MRLASRRPKKLELNHPAPLLRYAGTCGYWWVSLPFGAADGSGGGTGTSSQAGLSVDGTAQKSPFPGAWWHLHVPGAESFWRRRRLVLGEGRTLRVTLTHCFTRLIAGRCRRFVTATAAPCSSPLILPAGSSACGARARRSLPAPSAPGVHGASALLQEGGEEELSPMEASPSIRSGAPGCRRSLICCPNGSFCPLSQFPVTSQGEGCLSWALAAMLGPL